MLLNNVNLSPHVRGDNVAHLYVSSVLGVWDGWYICAPPSAQAKGFATTKTASTQLPKPRDKARSASVRTHPPPQSAGVTTYRCVATSNCLPPSASNGHSRWTLTKSSDIGVATLELHTAPDCSWAGSARCDISKTAAARPRISRTQDGAPVVSQYAALAVLGHSLASSLSLT